MWAIRGETDPIQRQSRSFANANASTFLPDSFSSSSSCFSACAASSGEGWFRILVSGVPTGKHLSCHLVGIFECVCVCAMSTDLIIFDAGQIPTEA